MSQLLNGGIHIIEGNAKLTGSENKVFLIFNLPARTTCPFKTQICDYTCYAAPEERYPTVRKSRQDNLAASMKDSFVSDMIEAIYKAINKSKYRGKQIYFRIHSSGDFYSQEYYEKWVDIVNEFPDINFGVYTKSLQYVLNGYYDPDNINMAISYSVMPDTDSKNIHYALAYGLKTFTAYPLNKEIPSDHAKCPGQCGDCTICYHKHNGIKQIGIYFHGARANYRAIQEIVSEVKL